MANEEYRDVGWLAYGVSRWLHRGWPVHTILTVSMDRLEFDVRILFFFRKKWSFQKGELYGLERKRGWWVIRAGFIINHRKDDPPMYMCYTTRQFDLLCKRMADFGWIIE